MSFINNTGIPQNLVSDGALEESKGNWEKVTKKYHIRQKLIIPHSPWANLAQSSGWNSWPAYDGQYDNVDP
jgi:hypothetical protein